MKRILIYGDSNILGYSFDESDRLKDNELWVNMLREYLGSDYTIIQDGLPGRIAGNIDDETLFKNGKNSFDAILRSCIPVCYVVIALGTNDLAIENDKSAEEIYEDLMWYKEKVKEIYREESLINKFPEFIYVLPGNFDYINGARGFFDFSREQERNKLVQLFKDNCSDKYIELNNIDLIKGDGVHYSNKGQQQVFEKVKEYFDI